MAHPRNCRAFVVCPEDNEIFYCDSKYHFDDRLKICNLPELANCQATTRSESLPTVTSPTLHITSAPFMALEILTGQVVNPLISYDPLNVKCRHLGAYFLPHPLQCRSYLLCAYGHKHLHSCGPHTLWDYKLQQCVLSHTAECYNTTLEEEQEIDEPYNPSLNSSEVICYPVTPPTTTTLVTSNEDVITTTAAYQIPSHSTAILPTPKTPSTTIAPPITTKASIPSQPGTSKKSNSSYALTIVCPNRKQSYVAHPKDCGKYFMCIQGNPVLTSCPPGLLWDSKQEFCVKAASVTCFA